MDGGNNQRRIDLQKIILSTSHLEILTNHAESERPNEACALLFGKEDTVTEIFLTKNTENSPVNFTISNEQLIEGYKRAEEQNVEVIGIFHSHPNSEAVPSKTDEKFMEANPVAWIIYSGTENKFRAYTLESKIREILIETIPLE